MTNYYQTLNQDAIEYLPPLKQYYSPRRGIQTSSKMQKTTDFLKLNSILLESNHIPIATVNSSLQQQLGERCHYKLQWYHLHIVAKHHQQLVKAKSLHISKTAMHSPEGYHYTNCPNVNTGP